MTAYRITREKFIRDLSGTGARLYGGRWNSIGMPVLYTASNRALCVLETIVHTPATLIPDDFCIASIMIPEDLPIITIGLNELPSNWRDFPAPNALSNYGDEWIRSNMSLVLKVPSVIVPEEQNILINPLHPEFQRVKIEEVRSFDLDDRLIHAF